MHWKNTTSVYGLVSVLLHWSGALLMIGLFGLGLYMIELDYYDSLYHTAPDWHRSLGVLTGLLILFRLYWRWTNTRPVPLGMPLEKRLAHWVHGGFYLLMALVIISGYLISTADGKPVAVFDWFEVPATYTALENQADKAGLVHLILAWITIILAALHTLAALKHHFRDRDATLNRMLGKSDL